MLFAAISDVVAEKGRVEAVGWGALAVVVVIAVAYLHRVVHDEFLTKSEPDLSLFIEAVIVSGTVIFVGTVLKIRMWSDNKDI